MKPVKAWAGLCDDTLYFSRQKDNYATGSAVVAELYRTRREAKERWRKVIRVELRELKPKKKEGR